jgi:hypothetical protein
MNNAEIGGCRRLGRRLVTGRQAHRVQQRPNRQHGDLRHRDRRDWFAADHEGAADRGPTWSADGTRIAFARWTVDDTEIWSVAPDGSDPRNLTRSPGTGDGDWDGGDWNAAGRIVFTRWSYGPATSSGLVRQDLAAVEVMLQALILTAVALLVIGLDPPFGAFTLVLGLATTLVAFQTDEWCFVPGGIVAGLIVDLIFRRAPPRFRSLLVAIGCAVVFVVVIGVTVSVSTGLAWSPTLLLGVVLASGLLAAGLALIAGLPRYAPPYTS